jgi:hypothetical protein
MVIRDTRPKDIPALLKLGGRMHQRGRFSDYAMDAARAQYVFTDILGKPGVFARSAWDGTLPLAMLFGEITQDISIDVNIGRTILLYGDGGFSAVSAVRKLVKEFEAWAKSEGANWVCLDISGGVDDYRSSQLFARMGFEQLGYPMVKEV